MYTVTDCSNALSLYLIAWRARGHKHMLDMLGSQTNMPATVASEFMRSGYQCFPSDESCSAEGLSARQ